MEEREERGLGEEARLVVRVGGREEVEREEEEEEEEAEEEGRETKGKRERMRQVALITSTHFSSSGSSDIGTEPRTKLEVYLGRQKDGKKKK